MGLSGCSFTTHWSTKLNVISHHVLIHNTNCQSGGQQPPVECLLHTIWDETGLSIVPYPFVLTLVPLLFCLRANKYIKGIPVAEQTYKSTAFSDNILLFLRDPHTSFSNLLKHFELFHRLSNFKINFAKSHALNITLPQELVNTLP